MRSVLPLTVYCISLVSLQRLLAAPAESRSDTNRLDLLRKLTHRREENIFPSGSQMNTATPSLASTQYPKWLPGFIRHMPALGVRASLPGLAWAQSTDASGTKVRMQRSRRHTHTGTRVGHHAQLMRVGCVLGTCQVQNLSHRLYQLIGQNGREDSSPINPRSPHSYG
ncbi:protein ADM2a [Thalassophryne amazonica]|uniref:protein ADM2a n=1 Tax=Thalassophryne amazonica TaxID=390379 RepID=UPI0014720813|nr:protein ADM2a [Thalassophryne amazonica]